MIKIQKTLHRLCLLSVVGVLGAWPVAAETEPQPSVADHESAIRQARAASNEGLRQHRVEDVVAVLEDDAQFTVSNGVLVHGRDDQKRLYTMVFGQDTRAIYHREPASIQIAEDTVYAAEQGNWTGTWSTDDGPVKQHGTYLAMWRRSTDGWRIRSEIFVKLSCEGAGCPKAKTTDE